MGITKMSEAVEMKDLLSKAIRHAHDACVNGNVARPHVHRQIFCMRLEGYALRECAEAVKLSAERTRQIEVSYAQRVQKALLLLSPDEWVTNKRFERHRKMLENHANSQKRRQEEDESRAESEAKRRAEEEELEAKREAKRWADYSALENVRARKADKAYSKLSRAEKLEFHIKNNPKLKGIRNV